MEDEEGKNLSGTGEQSSCSMVWVREGTRRGRDEEGVSDDAGVMMQLLRATDFKGVIAVAVTAALPARAVPAIAFCFFASFSKLWSTVN